MKLDNVAIVTQTHHIECSNDDPRLTLAYFCGKVKVCYFGFSIGKVENNGFVRNYCSL